MMNQFLQEEKLSNHMEKEDKSYLELGIGLLLVAPVFFFVGLLVLRTNRRNRLIPKAD